MGLRNLTVQDKNKINSTTAREREEEEENAA